MAASSQRYGVPHNHHRVAERQLRALAGREQRLMETAIRGRLTQQPMTPTRAIKRLRPSRLVEFELPVGDSRVLYNVERDEVFLLMAGRKAGDRLLVEGEELREHQGHPAEPTGGGPARDAE